MLNSVVPTWANDAVVVSALASTENTSVSGGRNRNGWSQIRPAGSGQSPVVLLKLSIIDTSGTCSPRASVFGPVIPPGDVVPSALVHDVLGSKPSQMNSSLTIEVWL